MGLDTVCRDRGAPESVGIRARCPAALVQLIGRTVNFAGMRAINGERCKHLNLGKDSARWSSHTLASPQPSVARQRPNSRDSQFASTDRENERTPRKLISGFQVF